MSDFRAIGGVSATLQTLLVDRMELPTGVAAPPLVTVSTPRPDAPDAAVVEPPRVNLFLYAVAEHPQLKNQEIPGRGHPAAYGAPPLSLTLHYLLTAYSSSPTPLDEVADETQAHMLLGSAMRVLHDVPIITDRLVTQRPPVGRPILHESLRGEFERAKVVLEPTSLENVTKVWTALAQRFRLSAAYNVSVVQIESTRPRSYPRPVGEPPAAGPRVHVVALRRLHITEVRVRRAAETEERRAPFARVGDTLILLGGGFAGTGTRVALGAVEVEPALLAADRVEVEVPDAVRPDGTVIPEELRLQPGPHPVAVVAPVEGLGGVGFRSNHAVFMLVPQITALALDTGVVPRELDATGTRLHHAELTGETIVGRAVVQRASYTTATPTHLRVPLPDTLPARGVPALVSGAIAEPFALPATPELGVSVAGVGTHTITLPTATTTRADAAAAVEAGLRNAAGGVPAFRDARVAAAGDRLVLVAGQVAQEVTVAAGATAAVLALVAPAAQTVAGYLSGALRPFPALTAGQPRLRITLGGVTHDVLLAARPATVEDAADLLQDAINVAGAEAAFTGAMVAVLGDQLLILPGAPGAADVGPVPAVDETSAAELRLRAAYGVRVRVNGAESIGDDVVELPP